MAYGILPDPETGGGLVYRDASGAPTFPPNVQNAYPPAPAFLSTCELTALPADCNGRVEAKQVNAIVSEMLSLAECWDANGPWDCNSLNNLCTTFNVWWEDHRPRVDNISIVGAGTVADPYRVNIVDGNGPQKVYIRRSSVPDTPPTGLAPGELSVEMANPLRLWVGVPAALDPSERKLLVPFSSVISSDTPPPAPIPNQLWWESDTGILWLWYHDGNSGQWVQVSSGGTDVPDVPTDADEIVFVPGGGLAANDVQEAIIELDAEKVAKNGDTMTGLLTLSGAPTADLHAATKLYVDGKTSAAGISFAPAGNVAATNVQAAIVELDTEKIPDAPVNGSTYGRKDGVWVVTAAPGGGPVANAVDIGFTPAGGIAATNVQAALVELDTEKLAKAGGVMTGDLSMGTTANANSPIIKLESSTGAASTIQKVAGDLVIRAKTALPGIIISDTGNITAVAGTAAGHVVIKSQLDAVNTAKLSLTGGTLTGALTISGNAGATITGHVTTYGWGGNNAVGIIFLNSAQNRYLIFDGTSYSMPGASLSTVNGRLWGTNDFNYTPANAAGQAFGGAISAPSVTSTGNLFANGGVVYFNAANSAYLWFDGATWVVTAGSTFIINPNLSVAGNINTNGIYTGPEPNGGVRLRISSSNKLTINFANPNLNFYIDDNYVKTFVIDHPTDPERFLAHGCLEGPEAGVYYRGKGVLIGFSTEIALPHYVPTLTDEESATIQVTPILTENGATPLAASEVRNGKFTVARAGNPTEHEQPFHWRVELTRKDVAPLKVEPRKDEIEVHGQGPYRYYSEKAQ